jgi:hypothetical protein
MGFFKMVMVFQKTCMLVGASSPDEEVKANPLTEVNIR